MKNQSEKLRVVVGSWIEEALFESIAPESVLNRPSDARACDTLRPMRSPLLQKRPPLHSDLRELSGMLEGEDPDFSATLV